MSQRGCAGGRATNLPPAQPRDGQVQPGSSRAQHPSVQGCPDPVPVAPAAPALCIAAASCLHGSSTLIPNPSLPAQCPQGGRDPPRDASRLHRGAAAPSRVPERMETRRGTGSCGINPRTCQPPRGHEQRQISALHCAKTSVTPLHLLGGGRSEDLHRPGCSSTQLGLAARHGVARKLGITASCLDVGLGATRLPGVVGTGPVWSVYGFGDVGGTRGCVHGCVRVVVREATRRQREL